MLCKSRVKLFFIKPAWGMFYVSHLKKQNHSKSQRASVTSSSSHRQEELESFFWSVRSWPPTDSTWEDKTEEPRERRKKAQPRTFYPQMKRAEHR